MKGRKQTHHSKSFQTLTIGELRKMPFGKIFKLFLRDISHTYKKQTVKHKEKQNVIIAEAKVAPSSPLSLEEKASFLVNELSTQVQTFSMTSEPQNLSSQAAGEVVKRKHGRPRKNN